MPRIVCAAAFCCLMSFPIGALVAQDDATSLILELLKDQDKEVRAIALEQVRKEAKGEAATLKFAELLLTLSPEAQVGLLSALADRGDVAAAPAVRKLLAQTDQETVKVAAIEALGGVGTADDVPTLMEALGNGEKTLQAAARASLVRIAGEEASAAIVMAMEKAPSPQRVMLIEILATRRAGVPEIAKAAIDDDATVRSAAMKALGEMAAPEQLPGMIQGVLKAEPGKERAAAERAVALVCQRVSDGRPQVQPLLEAIQKLPAPDQHALLPTVGRVGGPLALEAVEKAIIESNTAAHAAGIAAICNWPDGTVGTRLLELARTEEHKEHRTQARKALIRVAPIADARTDQRRLDLVKTTFALCHDDAERKLVLQRAKSVRTIDTLRYVASFLDDPKFAQQACETIVELAHHRGLREPHKAEFDPLLVRVVSISKDPVVIDRAQRYKKGQTWNKPKPPEAP